MLKLMLRPAGVRQYQKKGIKNPAQGIKEKDFWLIS